MSEFEVFVSKADFKFNCAHFIIYKGFRERLHGHNYQLSVRVTGSDHIGVDGYLVDFGDIKKQARLLCKSLNEYFICPVNSPNVKLTEEDGGVSLCMECDDGSKFVFPKADCALLPITHSSVEELAHYFWVEMLRRLGLQYLQERSVKCFEISVAEAHNQLATYRGPIPENEESLERIAQSPIKFRPRPCFEEDVSTA